MGRRSLITKSTVNFIFSSIKSARVAQEKEEIIFAQKNIEKELDPTFTLLDVKFNESTRVANLVFLQSQQYRTIAKYITQNYVKYPVYSDWKTKTKKIHKTIRLKNSDLENLEKNDDELIRMFAKEIILRLNNEDYYPSWFINFFLQKEMQLKIKNIMKERDDSNSDVDKCIISHKKIIKQVDLKIDELIKEKNIIIKKKDALIKKKDSRKKHKNNFLLCFLTFGIYVYLCSKHAMNNLEKKMRCYQEELLKNGKEILKHEKEKEENKNNILSLNRQKEDNNNTFISKKETIASEYNEKLSAVLPLVNELENVDDYIMLKNFSGLEYEKIIGVYVIRNRFNNKYYVGQSKDVMKRIRSHFQGTYPKNTNFAEDYFSCEESERKNLFEIKIYNCNTKDELDNLEKELIEKYNSYDCGYNKTKGNI